VGDHLISMQSQHPSSVHTLQRYTVVLPPALPLPSLSSTVVVAIRHAVVCVGRTQQSPC
jgi:hypothetical protein